MNLSSLKEFIEYINEGKPEFETLSYLDDKNASDEEKARDEAIGGRKGNIRMSNIDADIAAHLRKAEQWKRSVCCYPNGHARIEDIEKIKWHFIDIDEKGGTKEEQFERIMSASLEPTLVCRGRAGHKVWYAIKDALWDKSSSKAMKESELHFKNIQQQLIEYFKADERLITPHYALRLPFTKNYKYWREDIVEETIIFFNPDNVYSQKELSEAFPPAVKKHSVSETITFEEYPAEIQEILETMMYYFDTNDIDYTDRGDRLSFSCPIHDDSSPSAYMYKNSLICHCSRGEADGSCEVGKGKTLGWVAEYLGWNDLKKLCDNINKLREKKYLNISLDDMSAINLVALHQEASYDSNFVNSILLKVEETMMNRSISLDDQTKQIYKGILEKFLSDKRSVSVCPLEPGGGKSTLMETYLKYVLEKDINKAGCIIVVERIETAKKLTEQLGTYSTYMQGGDIPFWKSNKSAYTMESAFTFKKCKKKLISYEYAACRGCPFKKECPIPKKYMEQMNHPIVVMTHARLRMESESLNKYSKWINNDHKEYQRNLIIIDEKPSLVQVNALTSKDYDQLLYEVKAMDFDIQDTEIEITKGIVNHLRENTCALQDGELLKPIDPNFSFSFKETWYKKYHGNDVDLLRRMEFLIREGGRVSVNQQRERKVYINSVNKYNFNRFNTVILDGTAIIDMEYNALTDSVILDVPRIKSYEKLTFYIDDTQSLSKSKLKENPILIEQVATNVRIFAETDKVLLLCYKSNEEQFLDLLKEEVRRGQVLINHYGNVKGSNNYAECTALVMAGIPHKGDPYYISKHEAIYGKIPNIRTNTINQVRRFQDPNLEIIKLNDQLVDAVQDILRVRIRNKDNTVAVKVFIPTKDSVFDNLLMKYFEGAVKQEWLINETYPEWYETLKELLFQLEVGEKIRKAQIKEKLGLSGDSGKKAFQRIQHNPVFSALINDVGIVEFNRQTYIRKDLESTVCD
ncbi:hypothetical protein ABET41_10865 [Metabacillus fastidiosus]|uniref:Replication origin-binding protein domain-containing protein n=1 Tax=Metabacillus fastidiosus TaxID=1458 RepID=A0ABU6NV10_9BACI|nr:hypothetical protein [Metabacillus fastidiosus]